MGSGEEGLGGFQLLSQLSLSIIGTMKGLFGDLPSNLFLNQRPISSRSGIFLFR
jgi:hypothetical protein